MRCGRSCPAACIPEAGAEPPNPQGAALEPLSSAGGAGKSFGLGGSAPKPPGRAAPVRPQFRLRASSFRHRPKGTKGRLRGSASGSASAPKGGALLTVGPPPKNPRKGYGGVSRGAVSSFRRASSTLPATHGGLRPFAQVTCHPVSRLWAPVFGVQACGAASLTVHTPKCLAIPGALPGPQVPKRKDAGARRASKEPAQPRVQDAGKRGTQSN